MDFSHACAIHFRGTDINGDKMKRLVPNEVPITSNYEEITFWKEIIKISNDDNWGKSFGFKNEY
jgi:hypothetical protein